MADSDSDYSSSSSESVPSRPASPQPQPVAASETATDANHDTDKNETTAELETSIDADKAVSDTSSSSGSTSDPNAQFLHLVWEAGEKVDGSSENRSDFPPKPEDAPPPTSIDFVVVPGFFGHWDDENGLCPGSGSSAWVKEHAQNAPHWEYYTRNDCRIFRYEYSSPKILTGRRSRQVIRQFALRLLRALALRRKGEAKRRLIYFVSHDIGGIIVKDALATAALGGHIWKDISEMARVLIFTGCPHRSLNRLDMEDRLSSFLYATKRDDSVVQEVHPSVAAIPGLADAVLEVNGMFTESKIPLRSRLVSVHAVQDNGIRIHTAFDEFSGTFGVPLERRMPEVAEERYSALQNYLRYMEDDFSSVLEEKQFRYERKLLALASPVYPFHSRKSFNPLDRVPEYQAWLNHHGSQILYIHGNHRVREVAEQVFYSLEPLGELVRRRGIVLYFSFNQWDVRCDSIRDMIATFLAQIINHYPKLTYKANVFFTQLQTERGWTETDLIQFFEWFRSSDEVEQVMCVINHFDECSQSSRQKFLDNVIYKARTCESPWKVVITSHQPDALSEELSGSHCVPIDLSALDSESSTPLSDTKINRDFEALRKLRPELTLRDDKIREELQFIDKLEAPVRKIILEQASVRDEWPDETSIPELFGTLNLSRTRDQDEEVLKRVLDWVLQKVPEQGNLRRVLSWLLYAVRPLTTWELATVVSLDTEHDRGGVAPALSVLESLVPKIQKWLAGIIKVEHNEVKFCHPRLHNIMAREDSPSTGPDRPKYIWEEVKETAHSDIATLCLKYLSRASVQKLVNVTLQVTDSETFETPIFTDRTNLASYAVQAWTHHFSLGSSRPELGKLLSQNGSGDLAKTLARGYWALSNPVTKSVRCLETLFSIFAGLGLLDVMKPQDEADAFRGLLEAACKGQIHIVQSLRKQYTFSDDQLLEALSATSSSGDEELMLDTLKDIKSKSKDPRNIVWPPVLIYRAGWLGLDRFAGELLALGCSPDPEAEWKSTTVSTPLSQASCNCHPKTVRVLVKHGADMNFQSRWDRNPLHLAAVGGHAEVVRVLVEEGKADISAKSDQDFTPTYLAAVFGNHKALELLLDLGGDPNMGLSPDNKDNGWSPLVVTAEDNFERCIQLLLDHGAHPDMASPAGTALKAAATGGHLKVCDMLLAAGADPNSKLMDRALLCDIIDMTPGHVKLQMLDKFLELGVDVNAQGFGNQTALHNVAGYIPNEDSGPGPWFLAARRYPREVAARKLLDHGADINMAGSFGRTALHEAICNNHSKALIEVLLDAGADTKQTDQWDTTPFTYARSNPEIVRLLLEKGADPNFCDADRFAPLLDAAWWGNTETVEILLEYGASVDLRDESEANKGLTAVGCAAEQGHGDIVRILAEAGADLKVKGDPTGFAPIHRAAEGDALAALMEFPHRIDVNQFSDNGYAPLHLIIPHDNLKRLVNAGANIEAETVSSKDTPLSLSALEGNLEAVKYLIKKGARVNHGAALRKACLSGNFDIKFLVEHDADVNQTCDNTPGSPLQALCVSNEALELPLLEEMLRYLLDTEERRPKDRRADVTVQSGTPGFAINTAAWNTTPRIIDLILEQKGGTTDVKDDLDRTPIHFAALSGIPNFEAILNRGGDITAKDKMGRTALHWAAQPGRSQVVEKIISLLSDKTEIDAPDIDGWTPLCWAARGTASWPHSVVQGRAGEPEEQIKVIKLLLENGANRTVVTTTGGEKWTPLKIARFSGCSDEVIQLLKHGIVPEGKAEEPEKDDEGQEPEEFKSRTARDSSLYCDACECGIRGFSYECTTCIGTHFCSKCHRHIVHWHSPDHELEQQGPEFEQATEDGKDGSASGSSDSSDSESEASEQSDNEE